MKNIFLFIIFLLISRNILASDQIIMNGHTGALSASATRFVSFQGDSGSTTTGTEVNSNTVISSTGTLRNFRVKLPTTPGAGKNYAFTVRLNGASSALGCTIADSATSCADTINSVVVAPGDVINIMIVPTGTPTAAGSVGFTAMFSSSTSGESIHMTTQYGNGFSASATNYVPIVGVMTPDATEANVNQVIATTGQMKNLYVYLTSSPGASKSYAFTLMVNGSPSALTCTISGTNTTCNDTTHSVSVTAGDILDYKVVPTGTPSVRFGSIGSTFLANTTGQWPMFLKTTALSTTTTQYTNPETAPGQFGNLQTAETVLYALGQTGQILNMYVALDSAPGAGTSRTFTFRNTAVADTSLAVTISDTATSGNASSTVSLVTDNRYGIKYTLTGTPASNIASVGLTGFIPYHENIIINGTLNNATLN